MRDAAAEINQHLENAEPALFAALSPMGRRAVFPPDIPFQAAEAKRTRYNGTIGVFTDGAGHAVPLPCLAAGLALTGDDLDRALLYSPIAGFPVVRQAWRRWQRRGVAEEVASSLPLVTVGLAHGLALVADLFGGDGRVVTVTTPFWGNYRQTFGLRTGAEIRTAPALRDGAFDPEAFATALAGLPAGEPAVAILNYPSNPGGYSPTVAERAALVESLLAIAAERPLVAVCDDAYAGLVYEEGVPERSLFWDLVGRHPQLVPVKVDGATKELAFFGGRVGFLTFAVAPDSPAAAALDSKVSCLLRATVGSPVATSQILVQKALDSGRAEAEVAEVKRIGRERYLAVKRAVDELDPDLLRPLPFNSGFFVVLEIPERLGVGAEELRRHLIREHDTGIVSIPPRHVRLATCSVAAEALAEMVARIARGVEELARRG